MGTNSRVEFKFRFFQFITRIIRGGGREDEIRRNFGGAHAPFHPKTTPTKPPTIPQNTPSTKPAIETNCGRSIFQY